MKHRSRGCATRNRQSRESRCSANQRERWRTVQDGLHSQMALSSGRSRSSRTFAPHLYRSPKGRRLREQPPTEARIPESELAPVPSRQMFQRAASKLPRRAMTGAWARDNAPALPEPDCPRDPLAARGGHGRCKDAGGSGAQGAPSSFRALPAEASASRSASRARGTSFLRF